MLKCLFRDMFLQKGWLKVLDIFSRSEQMIGAVNMRKLADSKVLLFGLGGVGGYAAEGLVRSGIGQITVVDHDVISESNINRQIIATTQTIGMDKVEAATKRILSINPHCSVIPKKTFFMPESSDIDFSQYDYVIDAIDTVTAKISIAEQCIQSGVPIISCMGTGNKINPAMLKVTDISKTSICPLARVMRKELKKHGITHLKVVYSQEEPFHTYIKDENNSRNIPGSMIFVPASAGLMIASEVVKDLLNIKK